MTENEQKVLAAMPGNNVELTARTGIKPRTVKEITRRLCLRNHAHICRYQNRPKGGVPHAIFARGKGVAPPIPGPASPSGLRSLRRRQIEADDFAQARAQIAAREWQRINRTQATWFSPLLAA